MGAGSVRARRPVVFGQDHVGDSDQLAKAPPDSIHERDTIAWRRPGATVPGSAAASLLAIQVENGVSAIRRAIGGWATRGCGPLGRATRLRALEQEKRLLVMGGPAGPNRRLIEENDR
jgi:hypothetical protein